MLQSSQAEAFGDVDLANLKVATQRLQPSMRGLRLRGSACGCLEMAGRAPVAVLARPQGDKFTDSGMTPCGAAKLYMLLWADELQRRLRAQGGPAGKVRPLGPRARACTRRTPVQQQPTYPHAPRRPSADSLHRVASSTPARRAARQLARAPP